MRREPALRDLSSEHHAGLVLVRRIRRATTGLLHFAQLLSDHIRFEENELFEVAQRRLSVDQLSALATPPVAEKTRTSDRRGES
jgi:hypothetical protein